ncbi:MAG: NADP-dependent 3-hydroxy acid dehydrogenase YdfG [Gammaproteobacteria bacterium]|jgi:NADP-dependent 3-hydroxy acid dehydrogenase YdfG
MLKDTITIITGAGSGIGRATALAFAAAGACVVLAGRREEPLNETARAVRMLGAKAWVRRVDLEDGDAAAALGAWALHEFGHVDVLVNNAGHSTKVRSLRYINPHEFDSVFKVNVDAVYRLTQSLLASMIARESGTIVTVASMAALGPGLLGGIAYGAAKAAEVALMKGMNAELRKYGIRACTIIPGEVNTAVLDNRPAPPSDNARTDMMHAEDIAAAIMLCVTLPARTLVEQIVMTPTRPRDLTAELAIAAEFGRPE